MATMAKQEDSDEVRFDKIISELAEAYDAGDKERACKLEWEYEKTLQSLDATYREEQKVNENWMYE